MALKHIPSVGEVLLCDFRGYERPEMVKPRPVVVIVRRLYGRSASLITVVPLSGQRAEVDLAYQVQICLDRPLSPKFNMTTVWAKCDMIAVVSSERLDRFHNPPAKRGLPHRWISGQLSEQQVTAIKVGVIEGLTISLDKMR